MKTTDVKIDAVDRKIISLLRQDGRASNKEIADRSSISEGTVRNRIRKLINGNVIKVSGVVNPDFLPEKNLVLIEAKIAMTKDLQLIAKKVAKLPGVISVYLITGRMDLMIEVCVEAKFGLIDFIGKHLTSINGIISTETNVVMKQYHKWLDVDIS